MEALAGDEIERALMDLGPLLGVSVKEEAPDEPADAALNAAHALGAGAGASAASEDGKAEGEGADSLASPARGSAAAAARCELCGAPLSLQDGTPKLMECLHSACEPCLNARVDEKQASGRDFLGAERLTVTCPTCRLQCQLANMIDQRFVIEQQAMETTGGSASGEQQCNSCEDHEPATSYCVDCAELICDNCVNAHQRLKITKDHTIKSKDEASAELQAANAAPRQAHDLFCRDHPQERLALFCETCDRLTCRDCQLQHHRDHKYQFSSEMAAQARATIAGLLSEVSYKRVLLGSAMKVIKDRQTLIADKKKALVHEITQTVVKLTNAINTRGKQLVLRLNEVCDGKQRTLQDKKQALEQLAAMTDHCATFVKSALTGSDAAVLLAKRLVCAHLQRIKSRRADIPNPEIPVRISLALDKLPDLVRVLSTIGAIVVDGKVDGAGGSGSAGAQGPYHPPAQASPSPVQSQSQLQQQQQQQQTPHSAVMALQNVAMHQSYVQSMAGVGSGGGMRQRALPAPPALQPHTPLRHPHVTSTTHPHHLHGMSELNLRGLLSPPAAAAATRALGLHSLSLSHAPAALAPSHSHSLAHRPQQPHAAAMHAYQQMLGAYNSGQFGGSGRRSGGPRTPSPAPPPQPPPQPPLYSLHQQQLHTQQQHQQQQQQQQLHMMQQHAPAKWHIPQQSLPNGGEQCSGGVEFKITLGRPNASMVAAPATPARPLVSSTNPKTPSPSLNGGGAGLELDKLCAESVQDLMATIAKLDSNGVQVVAEPPAPLTTTTAGASKHTAPSPAPLVHSSTDADAAGKSVSSLAVGGVALASGPGDPNEDWCAVCMDGGELMCCDKCPKVFHQYCHIPTIDKLPDESETWQCLLCVNFAELPPDDELLGEGEGEGEGEGPTPRQQKLMERITLELYCQYEPSLSLREAPPGAGSETSICLDAIRLRLQPHSPQRYRRLHHFVADCRLLFRTVYRYNSPECQMYKDAKTLEEFFDAQLLKWLPEYAYWSGEGEPPLSIAPPPKRPRLH